MTRTRDMTRGNPFGLLFGFAFSLMIGNVFQQLYTFVDTMIVGKYLGVTALAALGATEWLVFVMFGCVQGMGNTVLPMCSSFLQLAMRVGCAFLLTKKIGQTGVFWGEICAWLLADAFLGLCLLWVYRRQTMMREGK